MNHSHIPCAFIFLSLNKNCIFDQGVKLILSVIMTVFNPGKYGIICLNCNFKF